jgi:hypothetical protein
MFFRSLVVAMAAGVVMVSTIVASPLIEETRSNSSSTQVCCGPATYAINYKVVVVQGTDCATGRAANTTSTQATQTDQTVTSSGDTGTVTTIVQTATWTGWPFEISSSSVVATTTDNIEPTSTPSTVANAISTAIETSAGTSQSEGYTDGQTSNETKATETANIAPLTDETTSAPLTLTSSDDLEGSSTINSVGDNTSTLTSMSTSCHEHEHGGYDHYTKDSNSACTCWKVY